MRTNHQITSLLIGKLGDKMIEEIYSIVGAEPVYFSMLRSIVRGEKIKLELKSKMAVSEIAKENNEFSFTANPNVVAFISDAHRKIDFNNLPSGATLYLSVAAQNNAGTGVPSAPVAIKTL